MYCNFEEVQKLLKINEFPKKNCAYLKSKWLKIFYYFFYESTLKDLLSKEITSGVKQDKYLVEQLKIDQSITLELLKGKYHFIDGLISLGESLGTTIDSKYYTIYICNDTYYIQQSENHLSREKSATVFSCILKTLIDQKHITENDEIIYICHDKHIDAPKSGDYVFNDQEKEDFINKVKSVLDGYIENKEQLKIKEIISFWHEPSSEILKSIKGEYYSVNYDSLIDKLKIQKEKNELNELKKKIINLWLPLAIDFQGLSEVQNDTEKAENYFKAVKGVEEYLASLESFPNNVEGKNEDFPRWEEIKEELQNGYKDFNPVKLLNEIKNKSFTEFDKKYFTDPNFLPNWLQEVVNIIDKNIKDIQNQ